MLVLASGSTARHQLLNQAGVAHLVIKSSVKEDDLEGLDVKKTVEILAKKKAKAVFKMLGSTLSPDVEHSQITAILGCDSLFEFNQKAFGKPINRNQALERWKRMSSNSGYLHTGYSLILTNKTEGTNCPIKLKGEISDVISTKIFFGDLNIAEIEEYLDTDEPFTCAGGFALEGRAGLFINRIEGCYSNVIGLSLPWLREKLKSNGIL